MRSVERKINIQDALDGVDRDINIDGVYIDALSRDPHAIAQRMREINEQS